VSAVLGAVAPAWRLFVSTDAVPVLQWRAGATAAAPGPWRASVAMTRSAPRRARHLIVNTDENARLYACSLIDALAADAQRLTADDVTDGVPFALVTRMVAREVAAAAAGNVFQLRIVLGDPRDGDGDDGVLLLTSPVAVADVADVVDGVTGP
jgi:hypothetical protein